MFDDTDRPIGVVSNKLQELDCEQILRQIEAQNAISIASATIQLYLSHGEKNSEWKKKATGVVCLVKDFNRRSIYFQMYNFDFKLIWEEEFYSNFVFHQLQELFYYFPGWNCNVGFNFAFSDEAEQFSSTVSNISKQINYLMNEKPKKRDGSSNLRSNGANTSSGSTTESDSYSSLSQSPNTTVITTTTTITTSCASFRLVRPKKLVEKTTISSPIDFVHLNHISLSKSDKSKFDVRLSAERDKDIDKIIDVLQELDIHIKPNPVVVSNDSVADLYSKVDVNKSRRPVMNNMPPSVVPRCSSPVQNQLKYTPSEFENVYYSLDEISEEMSSVVLSQPVVLDQIIEKKMHF